MPTNQFLIVAPGPTPNVASQATYVADPIVTTGNVSGVAKSPIINKALRQSSAIAATVAQYICDTTGQDAIDDGTLPTLLTNLKLALSGKVLAIRNITSSLPYVPTAGTRFVYAIVQGAGGGGGGAAITTASTTSAGVGGGEGARAEGFYPVSSLTGQMITVGNGGTAGAGAAGGNGGASSIGSVMIAPGGVGGGLGTALAPPWSRASGNNSTVPTGGNIVNSVGKSGDGATSITLGSPISGAGGDSHYGAGGASQATVSSAGQVGTGSGAGGSGGVLPTGISSPAGGGAGANGVVTLWELG